MTEPPPPVPVLAAVNDRSRGGYLRKIDLRFNFSIFVGFDFDNSTITRTDTTLLLQKAFGLWCDVIEEEVYELPLFGRGRKVDVMKQEDSTKISYSQRCGIKVWLQVLVLFHGLKTSVLEFSAELWRFWYCCGTWNNK